MNKELIYITYQTFPGNTANSIQTISTLKHMFRQGIKTTLIFPLRNKESSSEILDLKDHYSFSETSLFNKSFCLVLLYCQEIFKEIK